MVVDSDHAGFPQSRTTCTPYTETGDHSRWCATSICCSDYNVFKTLNGWCRDFGSAWALDLENSDAPRWLSSKLHACPVPHFSRES